MFREDILWFIPAIIIAFYQVRWIWGRLPLTDHKETEIKGSYNELDRFKFNYLICVVYCLFFLQLVFNFWEISNEPILEIILKIIGNIFIVSNFFISKKALNDLGNNWTAMDEYRIKKKQVLVTKGGYSLIRHPIYLAAFMEILGFELIANSWLVVIIGVFIFWFLKIILSEKKCSWSKNLKMNFYYIKPRLKN